MLDKLSTESAFLKIEALAAAAGFGGGGAADEQSILRSPQRGGERPERQQGGPRGAEHVA